MSFIPARGWRRSDAPQRFRTAAKSVTVDALRACFPPLVTLSQEAKRQIEAKEKAQAEQARKDREPHNRLFRAYARYIYLQFCNQVRQGYLLVHITDAELERAHIVTKAIETAALAEKSDLLISS